MFFSLFRQRERTKRDHVARFESDKMWFFTLCCGTRFAQTGPRTSYGAVFSHLILYLPLSLSQLFNDNVNDNDNRCFN